jgi:hypothetical protein
MNLQVVVNRFLVAVVVATSTVGCGGDRSDTVPVEGTVTYRGEPLANAALTFFPESGRPTTVPADSGGAYSAELPPGDYAVIVNLSAKLPPGWREGDPLPPPKVVLPTIYTTRAKSTLTAHVDTTPTGPVDFELK